MVLASMPWVIWSEAAATHLAWPAAVLGPLDLAPLARAEASLRAEVGLGFAGLGSAGLFLLVISVGCSFDLVIQYRVGERAAGFGLCC